MVYYYNLPPTNTISGYVVIHVCLFTYPLDKFGLYDAKTIVFFFSHLCNEFLHFYRSC